jgi:hypothetical protein
MKPPFLLPAALLVYATLAAAGAQAGTRHIYSYDPADAETRNAAGPLTFEIDKPLIGPATIVDLRSTVADATADLKRVDPRVIGPDDPAAAIGDGIGTRSLYQVEPGDQGAALISALCPGSNRAWMAFSRARFDQPLAIAVMGDKPGSAGAHVCHKLVYDFHGEWKAPPSGVVLKEKDVLRGKYPGT